MIDQEYVLGCTLFYCRRVCAYNEGDDYIYDYISEIYVYIAKVKQIYFLNRWKRSKKLLIIGAKLKLITTCLKAKMYIKPLNEFHKWITVLNIWKECKAIATTRKSHDLTRSTIRQLPHSTCSSREEHRWRSYIRT